MDLPAGAPGACGHILHNQASEPPVGWRHSVLWEFEQRAPGVALTSYFCPTYEILFVVKEERKAGRDEGAGLLCVAATRWQEAPQAAARGDPRRRPRCHRGHQLRN